MKETRKLGDDGLDKKTDGQTDGRLLVARGIELQQDGVDSIYYSSLQRLLQKLGL